MLTDSMVSASVLVGELADPLLADRGDVDQARRAGDGIGDPDSDESRRRDALGVDRGGQDGGDSAGLVEHVVADFERVPIQPTEPGCA
jgi:hypothetical protein